MPRIALAVALLAGCAGGASIPPLEANPVSPAKAPAKAPAEALSPAVVVEDRHWLPPLFTDLEDEVHYYISRLTDRRFVDTYGGAEHPRPWYIAAERLGQIGETAIPLLVARLDTTDEYELMLVLYALMLASQAPALMATIGGDYIELGTVLDLRHNTENRDRALAWWQRHGWRWR
ncbi:hypothetical protein ACR80S_06980 [Halomonas sp. MA07-2]|uniref:hypothetical protein n=1 Tax=unclassified Halomonas TaxID=2609666 RepID=UPI003EEAB719